MLHLRKKYFDTPLSHGLVCLYTGKTMVMAGTALLGLFLPIFLYNLFNHNFQLVVIYYGLGHLFYGLIVVFGARLLNKIGFRKALQVSVILGALFYTTFYFMDRSNFGYFIPLSLFIVILYRLFYWVPYHTDFAKFSDHKNRARQVSLFNATRLALGIFIPLIAGLIIVRLGFDVLFVIVIILYLASGIPYLVITPTQEKFSWSFKETWNQFFSKKRRRIVLAYTANGAENFVELVIWPIFIYQILEGNYFQVGAISTLIIGVTVLVQLILGKAIDLRIKKEKVLKWGSFFYAIGWIIKSFITTAFHIFVAGVYHNIAGVFLRTPFDSLKYEIAADEGHYVDEITVLHEMAINLGKGLMAILVIFISLYLGIQWAFILAALSVIFLNLLRKRDLGRFKRSYLR